VAVHNGAHGVYVRQFKQAAGRVVRLTGVDSGCTLCYDRGISDELGAA
jgi:hypothetical protein